MNTLGGETEVNQTAAVSFLVEQVGLICVIQRVTYVYICWAQFGASITYNVSLLAIKKYADTHVHTHTHTHTHTHMHTHTHTHMHMHTHTHTHAHL